MTLLFMDGFDMADTSEKWGIAPSSGRGSTISTRYGVGRALALSGTAEAAGMTFTPSQKVILGVAFARRSSSTQRLVAFSADGVGHIDVRNSESAMLVYRGTTLIATFPAQTITSEWHFIEISLTIANTGGEIEMRMDGQTIGTFTGDTQNGGTSTLIDTAWFGYSGIPNLPNIVSSMYYDDLRILNSLGTVNNDFMGEAVIQTLVPTGPGSLTEQIPVGSASNWQNVDNVPYSTSAYNYATADNTRDLYAATDALASLPIVEAVAMNIIAMRTDPGAGNVRSLLKTGATTVNGPTTALTPNIAGAQDLLVNNPATGLPWTVAELNAIEIGSEVL